MDNYKTIEQKLQNREPFRGNSMSAIITKDGVYEVYSYNTAIAYSAFGISWVSPQKYSVTTSRQQNLIRRAWAVA